MTDEVNEDGMTIVSMAPYCSSHSPIWSYAIMAWFVFLMAIAVVLAFQTRNIREEFNESKALGLTAYAHFLFIMMVMATTVFQGALPAAYLVGIQSVVYSLDTIITLAIYFLPKFASKRSPSLYRSSHFMSSAVSSAPMAETPHRWEEPVRPPSSGSSSTPTMHSSDPDPAAQP